MKRRLTPRQVILCSVLVLVGIILLTIGGSIVLDRLGVIDLNDPYSSYWMAGIAVAVLTAIAAIVQILGYSVRDLVAMVRGRDAANPDHLPGSELFKHNRQVMLQQVRDFWVKGVFEHSLYQSALLSLGKEYRPELVTRPWNLVMKTAGGDDHVIPRSTEILELYDQSSGSTPSSPTLRLGAWRRNRDRPHVLFLEMAQVNLSNTRLRSSSA